MTTDDIMKLAVQYRTEWAAYMWNGGGLPAGERMDAANTALRTAIESLVEERDRLREALDVIASWSEGDEVNSGFDEPESARTARAALEGKK